MQIKIYMRQFPIFSVGVIRIVKFTVIRDSRARWQQKLTELST